VEAAQRAARAGFPADFDTEEPFYDARLDRPETDLPDPDHAYDGLAEPLADSLFAAVERRRDALGPLEFVLVRAAEFPMQIIAVDASFVDRGVAMGHDVRELLFAAQQGPPGTVLAGASDTAPPELLQRIRAGRQALELAPRHEVWERLMRELVIALNDRPWSGVAPTFLALTQPPHADHDQDVRDASVLDSIDQEALMASIDPALPNEERWRRFHEHIDALLDAPRPRRIAWPDLEAAVGRARVNALVQRLTQEASQAGGHDERLPRDRTELAEQLRDAGLTADQATRVAADALWAIVLERGGTGRTRLGGAPILPVDTPWPTAEDRPLTHLATIALDELPDVEGREHLPATGTLSFFADLSDEGELIEPVEPSTPWGHDLVAIIYTSDSTAVHEPTPPDGPASELRMTPVARLQLRHLGFGYGYHLFGLDALVEQAVVKLAERINGPTDHQLFGYPQGAGDDPRGQGQIELLHLADDPALGFMVMDAGDIHFLGTPQDIRAQRWHQITVWPGSA
jgi:hypothetical protein